MVVVMVLMVYLVGWECTQHDSWLHILCSEMLHFICVPLTFIIYWTFPKTFISATQGPCHKTYFNTCNYLQWISYEKYDLCIGISIYIFNLKPHVTAHNFVACVRVLFYHDVFLWRYSSRLMKLIERYGCSILHDEAWRCTKTSRHTAVWFLSKVFRQRRRE